MFGLVSHFLSQLWEGKPAEEVESFETEQRSEANLAETRKKFDNFEAHGANFESEELKKVFSGKVTKLYDDSGVVDDEVYFTFDKVVGGLRPKLNTEVHIEASRVSIRDGWRADRVDVITTDWSELGVEGTEEVLIGDITDIMEKQIVVNYDVYCPVTSLAIGYVPCKGDWVRVEVIKDKGLVCDVKVVAPLRERSLMGVVSAAGCGYGYIDTNIFFSFGSCKKNYVPKKGHTVKVTAIESNQGNCKWRAVKVEPRTARRHLNNSPSATRTTGKFMKKLLENKENIFVSDSINFGEVALGQTRNATISIRNDGECSVILKSVDGFLRDGIFNIQFAENGTNSNSKDIVMDAGRQHFDFQIDPQSLRRLEVTVNARLLGEFNQLVVFNFGEFQIGRYFIANIRDKQQDFLDAKTPYQRRKYVDKKEAMYRVLDLGNNQQWIIPGERPMYKQKTINISTKLSHYEIPRTLRQHILNRLDISCLVPSLAEPLSMRNYKERFSTLLHAEETQMELEMREFDLRQVSLKHAGDFLSLAVPGLAEGRPSLLIGDRVILSVSGGSFNSPNYEGFIHEVLNTDVLLKFHEEFHVVYDMDTYDVTFFFNRTPLRRCHKAVESANYLPEHVLFPCEVQPKLPQTLRKSKKQNNEFFNSNLNERQRAAVSRIVSGQCRPMPYILFGPPGTGKTVTLVEAILQIFHRICSSRILACTPSNSAADLIAERLHHSGSITEGDMVRLNAFQRQQNIPEDIENYSASIQKLDLAAHYRIVICTCTTAGQLHTLGLAPGHFTHVIIDEAGQATEPESLVPISFLAGIEGQIVLSGDPYQLGAVLRSPISQTYGLDISLLERLMQRTPYLRNEAKFSDHGSYDPLAITKLINNYRSHESLLELPSKLFYHNEMVPCAEDRVKNCLCTWDSLPNRKGFPVLFHGVKGDDLREGNSPSWFNAVEAVQVIRYVQDLRKFEGHPVKFSDIGIITPYRKQVEKIRLLLSRLGLSEVKVGSVEEFQGQERLVIIISTVRSRENFIGFDCTHNIGFLSNPKRFNVAITRAQALMIVIGNPHVLVKDTNWQALLQYCVENNSYVGCELPALQENTWDKDSDVSEDDSNFAKINNPENGQNLSEVNVCDHDEMSKKELRRDGVFEITGEKSSLSLNENVQRLPNSQLSSQFSSIRSSNKQDGTECQRNVGNRKGQLGSLCVQQGTSDYTESHLVARGSSDYFANVNKHVTEKGNKGKDCADWTSVDKLNINGQNEETWMNEVHFGSSMHNFNSTLEGEDVVRRINKGRFGTSMDNFRSTPKVEDRVTRVNKGHVGSSLNDFINTFEVDSGGTRRNDGLFVSSLDNPNPILKIEDRVCGEHEGDFESSVDSLPCDSLITCDNLQTNDSEVSGNGSTVMISSGETVDELKLISDNSFKEKQVDSKIDNEAFSSSALQLDDMYESSEEDLEEIVYKGEMT